MNNANTPDPAPMSVFERYLTVWVVLCILAGIALRKSPFEIINMYLSGMMAVNG